MRTWIALLAVLVAGRVVLADTPAPEKPKAPPKAEPAAKSELSKEQKAQFRQLREAREKMVRERGDVFAKITVKHDYSGEYVLFRDQDVTAFLDLKDPQHPRYTPEGPPDTAKRRGHILVVPNQPRETIGKTVASDITTEDLELTLKVMHSASALAAKLNIKDPKIYVKSPGRVGVGYLHVHIVGERDPKVAYPPALK